MYESRDEHYVTCSNRVSVRHPRRGTRRRQYTFLIYLLRYAFCFSEIVLSTPDPPPRVPYNWCILNMKLLNYN